MVKESYDIEQNGVKLRGLKSWFSWGRGVNLELAEVQAEVGVIATVRTGVKWSVGSNRVGTDSCGIIGLNTRNSSWKVLKV